MSLDPLADRFRLILRQARLIAADTHTPYRDQQRAYTIIAQAELGLSDVESISDALTFAGINVDLQGSERVGTDIAAPTCFPAPRKDRK